ncbi:MAG: antitoxin VapB family protein [archaeon]
MATKTLTITTDAYDRLAVLKRERESFSDVIRRITGERSLLELAGSIDERDAEDMENAISDLRMRMGKPR